MPGVFEILRYRGVSKRLETVVVIFGFADYEIHPG